MKFRPSILNIISLFLSLFLLLVMVVLIRTFTLNPRLVEVTPCNPDEDGFIILDSPRLERFQQALRFQTVSYEDGRDTKDQFALLNDFIKKSYPAIHSSPLVTLETVSEYSLLYRVRGGNSALAPYLLMGHTDVVPASPGEWDAPPFSGELRDGYIYGRGAIDNKHQVFGILEALEYLLIGGFQPERTFYLAFGHDEELLGLHGAAAMGSLLLSRGVEFEFILDEGLTVSSGLLEGMEHPAALIGSSEKGYATLSLSVNMTGGHSSMPGPESAIGVLAAAVARLEAYPQPSMLGRGPEVAMLEQLAPEMNFLQRVVLSNLWLFEALGILSQMLGRKPPSNALIRTTTAVTMFHAGIKTNVLAPSAVATVNHRIHPAQTLEEVLAHDRWAINDDRVKIEVMNYTAPLPQSPYHGGSFGYQTIKQSIRQVWGHLGVAVAPSLMVGNTDTKHYTRLSKNIYRFAPTFLQGEEDVRRFHGLNERISVKNYEQAVNFYCHLIRNADRAALHAPHTHAHEL